MAAATRVPGGLAIDESTANVPPGWQPGLDWYPFRLYVEKIKIWYQTTEWADDKLGPVIAQRLKDGALRVALTLKLQMPIAEGGNIVTGGAAWFRQRTCSALRCRSPLHGTPLSLSALPHPHCGVFAAPFGF